MYGKVTSSEGNVYVDRRPAPVDIRFDFDESSSKNFVTSNAASARYISLLMVAGGMLGWVKFKPGVDTVMFGGVDDSKIRVFPKSYGTGSVAAKKPAPAASPTPPKKA